MGWHRLPGFPVPAARSVVAHFPLCGFTDLTTGKRGKLQPQELKVSMACAAESLPQRIDVEQEVSGAPLP